MSLAEGILKHGTHGMPWPEKDLLFRRPCLWIFRCYPCFTFLTFLTFIEFWLSFTFWCCVSLLIFHYNTFFSVIVCDFSPTFQCVPFFLKENLIPPTHQSPNPTVVPPCQEKRRRLRKTLQQAVAKVIIEQRATKAEGDRKPVDSHADFTHQPKVAS